MDNKKKDLLLLSCSSRVLCSSYTKNELPHTCGLIGKYLLLHDNEMSQNKIKWNII